MCEFAHSRRALRAGMLYRSRRSLVKLRTGPMHVRRRRSVREKARTPRRSSQLTFDIVLASGFRGHAVAIMVDGQQVYRQSGVTTDPATSQADALVAMAKAPHVRIVVCATPGDVMGVFDCDLSAHRHVAISLVGKATLSLETYAREFTGSAALLPRVQRA